MRLIGHHFPSGHRHALKALAMYEPIALGLRRPAIRERPLLAGNRPGYRASQIPESVATPVSWHLGRQSNAYL